MQVGVATGDPDGNWSGTAAVNIARQTVIPGANLAGKTTVNPNCAGSIVYNKGTPTELDISYVADPKSQRIFGLVVNNGTVASCMLPRVDGY